MLRIQKGSNIKDLRSISSERDRLAVQEMVTLEQWLGSDDPDKILKAQAHLKDVEGRSDSGLKSVMFDPTDVSGQLGYKNKPFPLSYNTLRSMAKTPIIRAIIGTRVDQVANFAQPQQDKYQAGFLIRKKRKWFEENEDKEPTKEEVKVMNEITDFLLNGGSQSNSWHGDNFDQFIRKISRDSLELDQMTFEVVRNRRGIPVEFLATDGATYRITESYDDDSYRGHEKEMINGYYPSYVQVIQEKVMADFYPWELCFGVRNQQTNIYNNAYGTSELEDLINIITWMLYSDSYNGKFFSQGSSPKGLLKVSGGLTTSKMHEFRQQWQSMVSGVQNAWKVPVINSEKMDWVDLQKSNKDMEFTAWQEYLIKLTCAIYKIDPSEVGITFQKEPAKLGGNDNVDEKLEFSKDKGLKPLLKFIQFKINKYIINPLYPDYEFVFVGVDVDSEKSELELDIKKVGSFAGFKEMRRKYKLPEELEEGDFPLNSQYVQMIMQQDNLKMQEKQMNAMGNPESNEVVDEESGVDEAVFEQGYGSNPIMESFNEFLEDQK